MKQETVKSMKALKRIVEDNIKSSTTYFEEQQWDNILDLLKYIENIEGIEF